MGEYDNLEDAEEACLERDDCGGITQEPYNDDQYTLRVGPELYEGVSPTSEISWVYETEEVTEEETEVETEETEEETEDETVEEETEEETVEEETEEEETEEETEEIK